MDHIKSKFKLPFTNIRRVSEDEQSHYSLQSSLHVHSPTQRPRRESQYHAIVHTMNKTIAGDAIKTWSCYFMITLAIHIALYIGIAKQNLREELYLADSSAAKFELFYVTLVSFILPLTCRLFLKTLAASVAGLLLSERAYSVNAACLLLAINLNMTPDVRQNLLFFHRAEKGIRGVILIRLVGDYIVYLMVPFISLAIVIHPVNKTCWMGFEWSWLLLVLLWPSVWSMLATMYMTRYWRSKQCTRATTFSTTPSVLQAGMELMLLARDAEGGSRKLSGKWRYGHRILQGDGYLGIDQTYLGLVRDEECISLTDMLLAIDRDDGTFVPTSVHEI